MFIAFCFAAAAALSFVCRVAFCALVAALVCSRAVAQMTGVTVEGNGGCGVAAGGHGVAQLEACAVSGNAEGDYVTGGAAASRAWTRAWSTK